MKITIYSTSTCPYCIMLKRWLDDKSIKYTSYDVDNNPIAAQNMLRLTDGRMGVPFSTIEQEDGTIDKIFGFDIKSFSSIIKI